MINFPKRQTAAFSELASSASLIVWAVTGGTLRSAAISKARPRFGDQFWGIIYLPNKLNAPTNVGSKSVHLGCHSKEGTIAK